MRDLPRRPHLGQRQDDAMPQLLLAFLVAVLAMVLAVAELLHGGSDWRDFVAIGLLLALAALVLMTIGRELDEQTQPGEHDGDEEPRRRSAARPQR